jgi:hypothetical protein
MDKVLASNQFTNTEIKYINFCRLHLQVVTISDITKANGTHIDKCMRKGYPSLLSSTTKHHHFNQPRPTSNSPWSAWSRAVSLFCTQQKDVLDQPLGTWLMDANLLRRTWSAYTHRPLDKLYRPSPDGFQLHHRDFNGYSLEPDPNIPPTNTLPPNCVPTDIEMSDHVWLSKRDYSNHHQPIPPPVNPTTFESHIQGLDHWEFQLLQYCEITIDIDTLLDILTNGEFIIASDGASPQGKGAFGWSLATPTGARLVKCYGPGPGHNCISYRAEGYGVLSPLRFLINLKKFFDSAPFQSYIHYCDNAALMKNLHKAQKYKDYWPNESLDNDWDILISIKTSTLELDNPPTFTHIKGHQDDHHNYADLPLKAQLNIDADRLASIYINDHHQNQHTTVTRLPSNTAQLQLPQGTITHHLKREILLARTGPALLTHIQQKYHWTDDTTQAIDWTNHRQVFRSYPKQTTLVKLIHRMLPVGEKVNKYDDKYSPQCPTCKQEIETQDHLHQCTGFSRRKWRNTLYSTLQDKANDIKTRPQLIDIMREGLASYLQQLPMDHNKYNNTPYQLLIEQQSAIGWDNFLRGRLSKEWKRLQMDYLKEHPHHQDNHEAGNKWVNTIIRTLWNQWFEMWKDRNKDRHGRDTTTRTAAKREQHKREITKLYEWKDDVLHKHKCIFDTPLEDLLE